MVGEPTLPRFPLAMTSKTSFESLPDEFLQVILDSIHPTHLRNVSLVSKRLDRLVKPALFSQLDLGSRNASELGKLHADLFRKKSYGDSPLAGVHLKSLKCRLIEETADESEFRERMLCLVPVLESISGVEHFTFEISLNAEESANLEQHVLPAIYAIQLAMKDKAQTTRLWLESYSTKVVDDSARLLMTRKLESVLHPSVLGALETLHLNGLSITALSDNLRATLASVALKELMIANCKDCFGAIPPPRTLHTLKMSWFGAGNANLATAMRFLSMNARTLKALNLQNLTGQPVPKIEEYQFTPLTLPSLTSLHLDDISLKESFLLGTMLRYTRMPKVELMNLVAEDIINFDADIPGMLQALLRLHELQLSESRMMHIALPDTAFTPYDTLIYQCRERGIVVKSVYSSFRCETPEDFHYEAKRMSILADTLDQIHLTCQPEAFSSGLAVPAIRVPNLRQLDLAIGDVATSFPGASEADVPVKGPLRHLLRCFEAPTCTNLQINLFSNAALAKNMLGDLVDVLEDRLYPNLEQIQGRVTALRTISDESFLEVEAKLRETCRKVGVDCRSLKFPSAASLSPASSPECEDEGWAEWTSDCSDSDQEG